MVVEIHSSPSLTAQSEQLWFREIDEIDLGQFDIENDQFIGRLYLIDFDKAKAIADAMGFTARFDHDNVKTATFEAWHDNASLVFAMAKNTRPADVGLRYVADRWQASEETNLRRRSASSLAMFYQAKSLPSTVWDAVCDELDIAIEAFDLVYMRLNFKSSALVLITAAENEKVLPPHAMHSFSIASDGIINTLPNYQENNEVATPTMTSNQTISALRNDVAKGEGMNVTILNDPIAKYATYSRSEVDLLLKKQAETIATNLNAKIANQQKAVQEAVRLQEQKTAKVIDDLQIYCETVRKKIEDTETKRSNNVQSLIDQATKQLLFEVEQFKSYVNRQATPNLRSLEDRVLTMVNTNILNKSAKPERDHATTMISLLALLLSIANLGLTFLKH